MIGDDIRVGDYFCSSHHLGADSALILVSKTDAGGCHLLIASWQGTGSVNRRLMEKYLAIGRKTIDPIDVRYLRSSFRPEWKSQLSNHLLSSEHSAKRKFVTVTEATAWLYRLLQDWGETNSVAILADFLEIDVNTVKARIAQARIKGLLMSPGQGKRLTKN